MKDNTEKILLDAGLILCKVMSLKGEIREERMEILHDDFVRCIMQPLKKLIRNQKLMSRDICDLNELTEKILDRI